jgi:hypothetical protein
MHKPNWSANGASGWMLELIRKEAELFEFAKGMPDFAFVRLDSSGQGLARKPSASSRRACCFRRGLRRRCQVSRASRLLIKGAQLILDRVQFRVCEGLLFFEPR